MSVSGGPIDRNNVQLRLQFQKEAAEVQLAVAGLVRMVHETLKDIRDRATWSDEDTNKARGLISLAHREVRAWLEIAPPPELQKNWQEMLDAFEKLDLLLEEFASLKNTPGERLLRVLGELQARFTAWIRETGRAQTRLAEREVELAAAQPSTHATRPGRGPTGREA
jgi:hypothetical protein